VQSSSLTPTIRSDRQLKNIKSYRKLARPITISVAFKVSRVSTSFNTVVLNEAPGDTLPQKFSF
jgi:hypothetical protein